MTFSVSGIDRFCRTTDANAARAAKASVRVVRLKVLVHNITQTQSGYETDRVAALETVAQS
jgi:hypothetical protein